MKTSVSIVINDDVSQAAVSINAPKLTDSLPAALDAIQQSVPHMSELLAETVEYVFSDFDPDEVVEPFDGYHDAMERFIEAAQDLTNGWALANTEDEDE